MRISNQVGKQIVAFFIEVAGEGEDGDGAAVDALDLAATSQIYLRMSTDKPDLLKKVTASLPPTLLSWFPVA